MIYDAAVIGAGLAGLSTAYHLAEAGMRDIVVLEQETKAGGHASGRNAGMIRQAVEDPILAALAREGRDSLERASRMGWEDIRFQANGSLFISIDGLDPLPALKKVSDKAGIRTKIIPHSEAVRIHPALKEAHFKKALYCPSDALVDIGPLLGGFLHALRAVEVPVWMGREIRSIGRKDGIFSVLTSRGEVRARRIVNAAGAWAGIVGESAGASRVPLKAYRRHLFLTKQYPASRTASWPFVWDLGLGFYFRPVADGVLLSPCDHTWERLEKGGNAGARKEQIDPGMKRELFRKARRFSPYFSKLKVAAAKSGLRTMAPDGRFVIGEDPKLKGFFWCAGLGGHGVTTCFSVGRLSADLVLGRKTDLKIVRALSPARFKGK